MIQNSFHSVQDFPTILKDDNGLNLYSIELDQNNIIYAFVKFISTNEELASSWFDLTQIVGTDFLCDLSSEFSRWNTYFIYVVKESVNQELKSTIEGNKIFVRKLVIDNVESNIDIIKLLNTKLLGFDIDRTEKLDNDEHLSLSDLSKHIISNSYSSLTKDERSSFISTILLGSNNEN
ncbi:TPA: ABC-three component system middle component 1 [Photobacterium damselae]